MQLNYKAEFMEVKKKPGQPPLAENDRQTGFTVTCKKKNIKHIKPVVKEYIKKLDKIDWSKKVKK